MSDEAVAQLACFFTPPHQELREPITCPTSVSKLLRDKLCCRTCCAVDGGLESSVSWADIGSFLAASLSGRGEGLGVVASACAGGTVGVNGAASSIARVSVSAGMVSQRIMLKDEAG